MIFIERSWSVIGFALRLSREIIQIDKISFPGVTGLKRIEIFGAYCNCSHSNYVDIIKIEKFPLKKYSEVTISSS